MLQRECTEQEEVWRRYSEAPPGFIEELESIGIVMRPGTGDPLISDCEVVAVTPMWDEFVEILQDVRGVAVDYSRAFNPCPEEPLYKSSINGVHPVTEPCSLIESRSAGGGFVDKSLRFLDAATDIPKLVRDMVNPRADSCPVAHAAPDGAYLMSVLVMFENVWFRI